MLRVIGARRHLALAFSVIALIVSAGSAGYAAATVGSADIVDNSIRSVDLKDGAAVKGVDVVNDSLTGADIRESTLVGVAHAVHWSVSASTSTAFTTLLTVAGMKIQGSCTHPGAGNTLVLRKVGPAGIEERDTRSTLTASGGSEDHPSLETGSASLPAGSANLLDISVANGSYQRVIGTFYLQWQSHLAVLELDNVNSAAATHSCFTIGTITLGA
jgi:hypothetical protein